MSICVLLSIHALKHLSRSPFSHLFQDLLSSLLYGAMTVINIFLPCTWLSLYVYLSIKFAGFPPSSKSATERLRDLTKLGELICTVDE
jgi:hypothetical protein